MPTPASRRPGLEPPVGAPGGENTRLAIAYAALFSTMGISLPYWPVWLAHRGMEPDEIGLLLGVFTWARLAAPWAGSWADRRGSADRLARVLAGAAVVSTAAFALAYGFVPLLLLSAALGLSIAPIMPLVDGIAVGAAAAGRLDYGRVRLWGSAVFVIVSSLCGVALQGRSPSLILTALFGATAALFAATWFLPAPVRGQPVTTAPAASLREMMRRPRMGAFLAAASFLQGSHAVLYGFGTRHWQAVGIPESTIGWLWAWGVIVEVGLFAIGQRLVARFRPAGLLVLAGLGGVVRWPLLAWVESAGVTTLVQTLHALTFAAMHLGAMSWIRDAIEPAAVQRATALYVATASGIALGLGMPIAGVLYERFAGQAYIAMGISSGLGLLFALRLLRWKA